MQQTTGIQHFIQPGIDFLRKKLSKYFPSTINSPQERSPTNTIDLFFGDSQVHKTLDGGVLKVEIRIKPPAINLLRALYEVREKGLDPQLYEVVDNAYSS